MADLPSGTVTLLFSDIEGSTSLLARLGSSYGDALSGQRRILRAAWASHEGTELGTEGDSFFVAFPTAQKAVTAAVQAQRALAAYAWPSGEHVQVRIGIHTGSPKVLDGGYVGMDVHRAARVAAAAHGGQVLLTAATAELVGADVPEAVGLRDLGRHRLKDIPTAEHVFQLAIDGLQVDFPALRSLGAASRLPVPATPLVGRGGEITELMELLRSPDVRLVALTGSGGSGKTRLAIGVARRMMEAFPDGVYFVALAAVTTPEVMWTSIAEVLDLPPDARNPAGIFAHVEHRSALFVLDNLEQLSAADRVLAQLLSAGPGVVVLATSRRPLYVAGEHDHPVPGLEVPATRDLDPAEIGGAAQLFVQHAKMVRPGFALTAENAADVVEVCRLLDGLPLAIELVAARSRLLSPRALLARMDDVLDVAANSTQVPGRHRTLRDTIAWSYDLLAPDEQSFFRQLGVFVGGADVDAIQALTAPVGSPDRSDPLDLVAVLVDASLVTVTESADGEPRIGMLDTIRMFARDELTSTGELETVRERHARVYLDVVEQLGPRLGSDQYSEARAGLEIEHANVREALGWAARSETSGGATANRSLLGLRLCAAMDPFWRVNSYFVEGRRWVEEVIERADGRDGPELAGCLSLLASLLVPLAKNDRAQERAAESVSMWRRIGGDDAGLSSALRVLALSEEHLGHPDAARPAYEEALQAARASGDRVLEQRTLGYLATFESIEHNDARSLELDTQALAMAREVGDPGAQVVYQHNMACTLRLMGRLQDADDQMRDVIPQALTMSEPAELAVLAEDYAGVVAELGHHGLAVRLLGAADAMRERLSTPRPDWQEAEIAEAIAKSRAALDPLEWDQAYRAGRCAAIDAALSEAVAELTWAG